PFWTANAGGPPTGAARFDEASSSTMWLLPDAEGRPATAFTAASSESLGPHPVAPGTANVSSLWTAPVIASAWSGPSGSGTPWTGRWAKPRPLFGFDGSLFCGFGRMGSSFEPIEQFGPSNALPSSWILIGIVMMG